MNKSLYWFLKSVSYLKIAILTTIGVVISIETVSARPACYLIDGSGRVINLSYVCIKKSTPKTETKPETQTETATPEGENTPENKLEGEQKVEGGENPPENKPEGEQKVEGGENPPDNKEAEKKEEEEELDPALFSPAQRTIPVLEKQRKETLTEE